MVQQVGEREPTETDYHIVSYGCEVPMAEAREWYDGSSMSTSYPVVAKILELSGIR